MLDPLSKFWRRKATGLRRLINIIIYEGRALTFELSNSNT